jgi:hypothetical protein
MPGKQATTADCYGDTYFGPEEDAPEEEQAADLTAWMADSASRSRARFLAQQRSELSAKLGRAHSRLIFLEAELRAERFEEFRRYFRGRMAIEQKTIDQLTKKLETLLGAE